MAKATSAATAENPRHDAVLILARDDQAMMSAYGKASFSAVRANTYVTAVAAFAVIGALCFGIDQGMSPRKRHVYCTDSPHLTSPIRYNSAALTPHEIGLMSVILVMKQFQKQFPELADGAPSQGFYKGLVTALLELGAFVGAFSAPHISDHFSRRMAMRVGCFFFLVGAAIQTGSMNYDTVVAGRFVGGLGIGLLSSTMSVYISEIAPPNMRGMLLDLNEFFVVLGIVIAYWTCFGTRYLAGAASFRVPFGLQMVPGVILFVGSFAMPPSPRWLAMKGRDDEALAVLAKLRQRSTDDMLVQAEWIGMRAENRVTGEVLVERHPTLQTGTLSDKIKLDLWAWVDTWRPGCWRRTLVSVLLCFFQQMIGINALIYYAPSMVAALGFSYEEQLVQSGIINVTQLAGTIISFFLIDRLGRKPLLVLGSIGTTVCMVIVGVLIKLFGDSWAAHGAEAKCALAFLNLYMVIFGISWGPVPWAMPSELFSSSLRARGVAWSAMSIWYVQPPKPIVLAHN